MTNPSKKKGTAAETAVVNWAQKNGYPHAERQPARGNRDQGDITLCLGVIVEVKDHKLTTGNPQPAVLAEWMRQTEVERENAGAEVGILIVKRAGTTDVGRWHAYVTAWTLAELIYPGITSTAPVSSALSAPACMTVADLTQLARAAGWGAPLDDGQGWPS